MLDSLEEMYPQKIFEFIRFHGVQLQNMGFDLKDEWTIQQIYCKLTEEIFDGGKYFQILDNQDLEELKSIQPVSKREVFLIDHAFTFRFEDLRENLMKNPELMGRIQNMIKYPPFKREYEQPFYQEFDDQQISDPLQVEMREDTTSVSFYGNEISDIKSIGQFLDQNKQLKVVWFNENPVDQEELKVMVGQRHRNIQILNSEFTQNADMSAVRYDSLKLDLSSRQIFQLPQQFLRDIGSTFVDCQILDITDNIIDDFQLLEQFLGQFKHLKHVLIDQQYECQLFTLVERVNGFYKHQPQQIDYDFRLIYEQIWPFLGTYRLENQVDSIYFLMDELGLSIQHSQDSNCKTFPFLYSPNNKGDLIAFNILKLDRDLEEGETLKRDFLLGVFSKDIRLMKQSDQEYIEMYRQFRLKVKIDLDIVQKDSEETVIGQRLKFYTDSKLIERAVTEFELVEDVNESDIIWVNQPIPDNHSYTQLVNQFPFEINLTMKDRLAQIIQQSGHFDWMQTTYDLSTQYGEFLGEFQHRKLHHLDNHWIIKHPNLARSIDMVVTSNLNLINKLSEFTPRIAQKYIEEPLLYKQKKFDLRFIEIYLYDKFWIRSANNDFNLDERNYFDYATHFTVNNYGGDTLQKILCDDFVKDFEQIYDIKWETVYSKIKESLSGMFKASILKHPEMQNNQSRAIYGIDVMINRQFEPKILELTYAPDCIRAVDYYPQFFNDIFKSFFLNQQVLSLVRI